MRKNYFKKQWLREFFRESDFQSKNLLQKADFNKKKKSKKTNRKNSKVTSNYKLKKKYQETSKPFIKINKKNYKCWWYWNWKIQFSPT